MLDSKDETRAESRTPGTGFPVYCPSRRRIPDGPGWITCLEGSESASLWSEGCARYFTAAIRWRLAVVSAMFD
jgi:hypothetical protein